MCVCVGGGGERGGGPRKVIRDCNAQIFGGRD